MLMAKPISVTGRARGVAARLGAWREDETAGRSEAMAAGAMAAPTRSSSDCGACGRVGGVAARATWVCETLRGGITAVRVGERAKPLSSSA